MLIDDILKNAFIVTDGGIRYEQFCRTMRAVGMDPTLVRKWNSCMIKNEGSMGNAVSQYSLVRYAKETNMPFLVVFEDDAVPSNDAKDSLIKAIEEKPENCKCLSLGWSYASDNKDGEFSSRTDQRRVYGSHAYVLFGEVAYDEYCKKWQENGRADVVLGNMADSFMNRKNLFAQHTIGGGIHLPTGWTVDAEIERIVDQEANDRFLKAREEIEKISEENAIHVIYTVDMQKTSSYMVYADQLTASVFSLKTSRSLHDIIHVHILYGHVPTELITKIMAFDSPYFTVDFIKIKDHELNYMQSLTRYKPTSDHINKCGIVFTKLWLCHAIKNIKKAIYLDADTLVMKSLSDLWKTDLKGKTFGMCQGKIPEYGFNSGVILMDLDKLRKNYDLFQKLAVFVEKNGPTFFYPDQTTINRFFKDDIYELDKKYNYQPIDMGMQNAVIWHWSEVDQKPRRKDKSFLSESFSVWNKILSESEKK